MDNILQLPASNNMMVHIFHHDDLDGYASAAVLTTYIHDTIADFDFSHNIEYHVCDYNKNIIEAQRLHIVDGVPNVIFVVDLSITEKAVDEVLKMKASKDVSAIWWIDHHQYDPASKCRLIDNDVNWCISSKWCAARLAYSLIHPDLPPEDHSYFIRLVDDYDRWVHVDMNSKLLNLAFYCKEELRDIPNSIDIWDNLINPLHHDDVKQDMLHRMVTDGEVIYKYKTNQNARWRTLAYDAEFQGKRVKVINCKITNSEIFGDLIDEYPLVITWGYDGSKYLYSLYSTDPSVDCSEIAREYGGGGHKGAAGFSSNEFLLKGLSLQFG